MDSTVFTSIEQTELAFCCTLLFRDNLQIFHEQFLLPLGYLSQGNDKKMSDSSSPPADDEDSPRFTGEQKGSLVVHRMNNLRLSSMQAMPPTDNDDVLHFVPEAPSPISFTSDDAADQSTVFHSLGPRCDSGIVFTVVDKASMEMPVSPDDSSASFRYSMQNCVRIEPSPERTLELPKRNKSPVKPDGIDGKPRGTIPLSASFESLRSLDTDRPQPGEKTELVQKLNNFFGESKPGFTGIESAVYNQLILGSSHEKQYASHASALNHSTSSAKFKKSSVWSLKSGATQLPTTVTMQVKPPKKSPVEPTDPSVRKFKEYSTTWHAGMLRVGCAVHTSEEPIDEPRCQAGR